MVRRCGSIAVVCEDVMKSPFRGAEGVQVLPVRPAKTVLTTAP